MPFVSRSCIETIKDKVSIYDVVAPYVFLKKVGSYWRGLSPFTNEKTPSFFVMPDKNIFKCFSTGYAGDIFRFIELKENLPFPDAVEATAIRFNITLEYEKTNNNQFHQPEQSVRKELFQIYELAAHYFHQVFLADNKNGQFIRDYWQKRNFSLALAKNNQIGMAPPTGNTLLEGLIQKKFSISALKQSGLFYTGDTTNPRIFKPRFQGRLIIPICDVQGRPIAFAGRQLTVTPTSDPAFDAKYINSPETPIFNKSRTLFGLHQARKHINETNTIILVEGQLDVLRCWEKGFHTAVSPQGTAITEQQLSILNRYCPKILFALDGDFAGQKAAYRTLPMAIKAGLEIAFFELPDGQDPDSFLNDKGPNAFEEELQKASSPVNFAVRYLLPKPSPGPREKVLVLNQLFEIISHCDSTVVQEAYLYEAAKLIQSNPQAVIQDFFRFLNTNSRQISIRSSQITTKKNYNHKLTSVEYQTLLIILNYEDIAHSLAQAINPDWIIENSLYATLLQRVLAEHHENNWRGIHSIDSLLEAEDERNLIYSIMSETPPFEDPVKTAHLCLKTIFTNFINHTKHAIEFRITQADDSQVIRELQKQRIELRRALQNPPTFDLALKSEHLA